MIDPVTLENRTKCPIVNCEPVPPIFRFCYSILLKTLGPTFLLTWGRTCLQMLTVNTQITYAPTQSALKCTTKHAASRAERLCLRTRSRSRCCCLK